MAALCRRQADLEVLDARGDSHHAPAIYIKPGVRHRLVSANQLTLVLIEPQSSLANILAAQLGGEEMGPVPYPSDLSDALDHAGSASQLATTLLSIAGSKPQPLDPRLQAALQQLSDASLEHSLASVAKACAISESRLRSIASEQLGTPLSKWQLWQALKRATEALKQGASLSEAATDGGFADQAHYTRTLKNMIGLTPGKTLNLL